MHIGRCFHLVNTNFQCGRKWEEPDEPHIQAGKISPNKKVITSRHCSGKGSQQTEEQTGGNAEEKSQRPLLESSCALDCRRPQFFDFCNHLQHR